MSSINLITGNSDKLNEIVRILGESFPRKIVPFKLDLLEVQGSAKEICFAKCREAIKHVQGPVLVEDTSLCLNALHGLPGPYIKWFESKIGPEGIYKLLVGFEDKSAQAVSTFAFSEGSDENIELFEGKVDGMIVKPKGSYNFGWDSCFQPIGFDITYAEMTQDEKNQMSHRFKALCAFKSYFNCDNST